MGRWRFFPRGGCNLLAGIVTFCEGILLLCCVNITPKNTKLRRYIWEIVSEMLGHSTISMTLEG